jgi:hypothetical protein
MFLTKGSKWFVIMAITPTWPVANGKSRIRTT